MKLSVSRIVFTSESTIGKLTIEGDDFSCYTLEDRVGIYKIPHKTAIPYGEYKVIITWSPRFRRELPLLVDVPGFDGIRIHPGNTPENTDGCILVGTEAGNGVIFNSRKAFDLLFAKLKQATDDITISIS